MTDGVVTASTDAGMLAVWCRASFDGIDGYDAFEARVEDRLGEAIRTGELVPLNIGSDGAFGVRLAVAPDALTAREAKYAVITSEPYLLNVTGGEVCVSGFEGVGDAPRAALRVPVADGRYAVRITMVAWDDEPGAKGPDGKPTSHALADFVVHLQPALGTEGYRTVEETFDRPKNA